MERERERLFNLLESAKVRQAIEPPESEYPKLRGRARAPDRQVIRLIKSPPL